MAENPFDSDRPACVIQRGERPPGILPRNTQAKVLGGVAVLMVLALTFSGSPSPKAGKTADSPASQPTMNVNPARIQEYRARIEEQTRKLALEQAQLAQTKEALGLSAQPQQIHHRDDAVTGGDASRPDPPMPPVTAERNWKADELARREFQSFFASNVALSYRSDGKPEAVAPALVGPGPSMSRKEEEEVRSTESSELLDMPGPAGGHRVMEGTILETVLTNRLDGSFSGPVNCLVTANVYSRDRRKVLIPQGSRVLGEAQRVETFGQQRLAVAFHRLILPNGLSFDLKKFKGLNQIGETGLRDRVNNHYLQVFGVSVALGVLAGFSQANTRSGFDATGEDAYRQGVANSVSQSSVRILDRYLNVLPTFTIREGHRVKVYLTADLLLPVYSSVDRPSPL